MKGSRTMVSGSKPQAITEHRSVLWPGSTGSRAAIDWAGVRWVLPPKGMSTEAAPMEPSNRSVSPRREAHFRLEAMSRRSWNRGEGCRWAAERSGTVTEVCLSAPLVSRKARDRSAMVWPFQVITILGLSVTTATGYASRFSA